MGEFNGGIMKSQGRFFRLGTFIVCCLLSLPTAAATGAEAVSGEYVVKMRQGLGTMSDADMRTFAKGINASFKSLVSSKDKILVVKKPILVRSDAALDEIRANPQVELVEPNYVYRASSLPNDSRLDELWGLKNNDKSVEAVDIDAQRAWGLTTGDRKVVVAVIDTGVNYRHPDLKENMWVNRAEANGQSGVDDDGNGFVDDIYGYDFANKDGDPMDDNDHGTHCAGTIGASGDNGEGVVGVNWNVSIMALKFLSGSGGGTLEDALKAIDYATKMGVDVMSNSWGGGGASATLKAAIERAEKAGILFVAAAGNDRSNNDKNPSYPANYEVPNVISVAAVDRRGKLASFSNYGKKSVHIGAPGVEILSTARSGYKSLNGTSMATPHVSGVAALMLAADSSLSYQQLKSRLLRTSVPLAGLRSKVSHGFLNAFNALSNRVPPADINDPAQWPFEEQSHATPHPYANDSDNTMTIQVQGASKVAVHFERFETERGFDKALFFDGAGNPLGELSGDQSDSFSPVADGDTIVIQFKSDFSITGYGFDIDRVHYKGDARESWRQRIDEVSTAHPYSNRIDQEVVFEQPGASEIRVQFGRFETEKNYDFVSFYDENGLLLDRWDGVRSGEISPTAQGDKLIIRLQTDASVTKYGFDVESIQYR